MKNKIILTLSLLMLISLTGCSQPEDKEKNPTTPNQSGSEVVDSNSNIDETNDTTDDSRKVSDNKISIKVDGKEFIVTLYDNPTANSLLAQLPLSLEATDYAGYDEKVIRLDNDLSMENAPNGDNPEIPEVGYYEPGNWIAIYYGHIGYWSGKVPLGRIDATIEELEAIPNNSSVAIEEL
ncbi:TPA: cyclophilin-like fold protein [Listeria monocytogenes]